MNTNEKGVKGLTKVIDDLIDRGYEIFLPFGDYSSVDLIAVKGSKTVRLQVKYRSVNRKGWEGLIHIPFYNVVNSKEVAIDMDLIDGWAVYVPDVDKVLYISKKHLDGSCEHYFSIRVLEAKKKKSNERPFYKEFLEGCDNW